MELLQGLEHVVRRDEPLARYSWFRLGGTAEYFAEPTNTDELSEMVQRFRAAELPVRILGAGSNVLISRPVVPGLVIHLATPEFCRLDVTDQSLTAGAGAKLGHAIATSVREGLGGLESLVGIPGTVGGALRRNAASHAGDIGQWTGQVTLMTRNGDIEQRGRDQLLFGYGRSNLDEMAILECRFDLEPGDPAELTRSMQKNWIVKRARQPVGDVGQGRIFGDPHGLTASELVEQAGMRNAEQGQTRVSELDANFIVTQPGAAADDILRLIERIRDQVATKLGVELELQLDVW